MTPCWQTDGLQSLDDILNLHLQKAFALKTEISCSFEELASTYQNIRCQIKKITISDFSAAETTNFVQTTRIIV
jgi:hypothetical protein